VLGELNLSVEAMLMPTAVDNNEEEMEPQEAHGTSTEELLPSVGPADDLLSRVGCDMDSGFSGSSSASYRYIGHLFSLSSAFAIFKRCSVLQAIYLSVLKFFKFNLQIGLGIFKKRNRKNERSGTDGRST